MFAQFKSIWLAVRASYWFYPALFSATGLALAIVLVSIDRSGAVDWLNQVHWLHPSRPEGASNMLTVLAGSMIAVASTVFSITIAAVAYASGTYGPRLLTNFMEDKGNQLSLGVFIGTFVYAFTVLRTVRAEGETAAGPLIETPSALPGFVPQLSLLVAFFLAIVSVGVLVYFLHHIPSSIRINSVLEGIGRRLLRQIAMRFPEENTGIERVRPAPKGATVKSEHTGYVRYIDLDELSKLSKERDINVALLVRTGDFVQVQAAIARIDGTDVDETSAKQILSCFAFGGSRTAEQDIEFSIDELVEITVRALSPGINDPFTAVTAIHWLGAATSEIGNRALCRDCEGDGSGTGVVTLDDGFDHYLRRGFGSARSAIASNRIATLVAFDSLLASAIQIKDSTRVQSLAHEAQLLMAQAEEKISGPDLKDVRARHESFENGVWGQRP